MELDKFDRRLLGLLQENATLSVNELAERVGLSPSPCWRRIQKLEAEGYIRARVALLDPRKMNLGVTVFAAIRTNQHNAEWLQAFSRAVVGIPEIVEVYRMSGQIVRTRSVVQSAEGDRRGRWTTVIALGVFVF